MTSTLDKTLSLSEFSIIVAHIPATKFPGEARVWYYRSTIPTEGFAPVTLGSTILVQPLKAPVPDYGHYRLASKLVVRKARRSSYPGYTVLYCESVLGRLLGPVTLYVPSILTWLPLAWEMHWWIRKWKCTVSGVEEEGDEAQIIW